jgi:hypothetical protein
LRLARVCCFTSAPGLVMPQVPTPQALQRELFQPQLAGLMLAVPSAAGAVPTNWQRSPRWCTQLRRANLPPVCVGFHSHTHTSPPAPGISGDAGKRAPRQHRAFSDPRGQVNGSQSRGPPISITTSSVHALSIGSPGKGTRHLLERWSKALARAGSRLLSRGQSSSQP